MVEKLIWTEEIITDISDILNFWSTHNNSDTYSNKLLLEIYKTADLIKEIPTVGNLSENEKFRTKNVMTPFLLIYVLENNVIQLISFWDARRNHKSQTINI